MMTLAVQRAWLMQKLCAECAQNSRHAANANNDKEGMRRGYELSFAFASALALAKSIWPA